MSNEEVRPFEELEKKRRGCDFEEKPKRQKVNDDDEDEDEEDDDEKDEDEDEADDDEDEYEDFSKDYSEEDDGYEDYSDFDEDSVSQRRMGEGCYIFSLPTNEAMDSLCKSFPYGYILPPDQVRARIQAFLKLLAEETNAAEAFVRVSKVMKMCSEILINGNRVHQGTLCYRLRIDSPDYFSSRLQANRTIQDAVVLLRCSTYSLGIMEYRRGDVAGCIVLQEPNRAAEDISTYGSSGYAIPRDLKLLERLVMKTDARCIIVVQRDEVFHRLATNPKFKQRIPSILLTANGYPDTATRFLLHRMSQAFPDLPILALVDWKPAGLAVLLAYKYGFGSTGMGIGACGCACNVKWLGLRGDDLKLIPDKLLSPLKSRDLQIAESLISSGIMEENYRKELELMMKRGWKAYFETLDRYGFDYLGKYIAKKIEQADYM